MNPLLGRNHIYHYRLLGDWLIGLANQIWCTFPFFLKVVMYHVGHCTLAWRSGSVVYSQEIVNNQVPVSNWTSLARIAYCMWPGSALSFWLGLPWSGSLRLLVHSANGPAASFSSIQSKSRRDHKPHTASTPRGSRSLIHQPHRRLSLQPILSLRALAFYRRILQHYQPAVSTCNT